MSYESCWMCFFFFFKQTTAYVFLISDWSSDVCSSDLDRLAGDRDHRRHGVSPSRSRRHAAAQGDRKSVVKGKSVSVRVVLGGRRSIQKKHRSTHQHRVLSDMIDGNTDIIVHIYTIRLKDLCLDNRTI